MLELGDAGRQTLTVLKQAGDEQGNALEQMLVIDVDLHLVGTDNADILSSGSWHDTLKGNGGSDVLNSGKGNDTLDGGTGNDKVTGGLGNNTYLFNFNDITITQESDGFVYIRINNTTDVIKFAQASSTSTLAIDVIYFADNSIINSTAILASLKTLTNDDDILTAKR